LAVIKSLPGGSGEYTRTGAVAITRGIGTEGLGPIALESRRGHFPLPESGKGKADP
jgi:hypothetical protein